MSNRILEISLNIALDVIENQFFESDFIIYEHKENKFTCDLEINDYSVAVAFIAAYCKVTDQMEDELTFFLQ